MTAYSECDNMNILSVARTGSFRMLVKYCALMLFELKRDGNVNAKILILYSWIRRFSLFV